MFFVLYNRQIFIIFDFLKYQSFSGSFMCTESFDDLYDYTQKFKHKSSNTYKFGQDTDTHTCTR